jgi:hypothetical protein
MPESIARLISFLRRTGRQAGLEAFPPEEGRSQALYDRLALAWLILTGLLIVCTFRDFGMTWDEGVQNDYGKLVLAYYAGLVQGVMDTRFLTFLDLYRYGALFDTLCALVNTFSPFDEFDTRHLLNALWGWAGIVGCWRLARHLAGPRAAFAAAALLTLTPPYFGDMFANPKDIPFAVGYVWSVYYFVRCRAFFPDVPLGLRMKTGLAVGVTLGVRVGGLLLLCYLGLFMAVFLIGEGIRDKRRMRSALLPLIRSFAITALVAYAVMLLCWPWAQIHPLLHPLAALRAFTYLQGGPSTVLFNGRFVDPMALPASYVPVHLAVKLPEITLALLIAGCAVTLGKTVKKTLHPADHPDVLIVVFTVVFPVVYVIVTQAKLYDGLRHVLFIVPPLTVLAGMSGGWCADWLGRQGRYAARGAAVVTAGYLLYHAGTMARLHPYEYVYFNHLTGGLKGADGRYETDYWGAAHREAVERLRAYLEERRDRSPYKIAVCFNPFLAAYYLPPHLSMTDDIRETDFLLATTRGNCHRWVKKGTVLFQIERFGVPLMVVRDLR